MISKPLLNDEYLQKEVNNIQSEQNIHLTNESVLVDDAINMQRDNKHPLSFFTCGNKNSLYDNLEKQWGLEVRHVIELFRRLHYTPDNGCLVISSFFKYNQMIKILENTLGKMEVENAEKFVDDIMRVDQDEKYIDNLKNVVLENPNYE